MTLTLGVFLFSVGAGLGYFAGYSDRKRKVRLRIISAREPAFVELESRRGKRRARGGRHA